MTELSRNEIYQFLATSRTPGWLVAQRVLTGLVQNRADAALDSIENTEAKTNRAGGARDLLRDFNKIVAGLADQISETAADCR